MSSSLPLIALDEKKMRKDKIDNVDDDDGNDNNDDDNYHNIDDFHLLRHMFKQFTKNGQIRLPSMLALALFLLVVFLLVIRYRVFNKVLVHRLTACWNGYVWKAEKEKK